MAFPPRPDVPKGRVDAAGKLLAFPGSNIGSADDARRLLSQWRACHLFPLDACAKDLIRRLTSLGIKAVVAHRLKRLHRIIQKLGDADGMRASRMDDIAGVRVIVPTVADVDVLVADYRTPGPAPFRLRGVKDYIRQPKASGYRSVHLLLDYDGEPVTYRGLRLELQIRTEAQHLWASAVEIAGMLTGKRIKYDEGEPEWTQFFLLAAELIVRDQPDQAVEAVIGLSDDELREELRWLERRLGALAILRSADARVQSVPEHGDAAAGREGGFRLLSIDPERGQLTIEAFPHNAPEAASQAYIEAEQKAALGESGVGPVLVYVDTPAHLQDAYRSFFLDTNPFVARVEEVLEPPDELTP